MKISTKSRYALRLLADLAMHEHKGYVSLKDVSERQGISKKYLEQIASILNHAGVLTTTRGYLGGYKLSRAPEEISVSEVLRVTENDEIILPCAGGTDDQCGRSCMCPTQAIWIGLQKAIDDYLGALTLADIVKQQKQFSGCPEGGMKEVPVSGPERG